MQDRGPVLQVLGPTGPGPSRTGRTDDHPYLVTFGAIEHISSKRKEFCLNLLSGNDIKVICWEFLTDQNKMF
ncbi:unnamed protein product [Rhizophagus irregularis]|nr:unnamed protein product [Rhizophagus irregularis]